MQMGVLAGIRVLDLSSGISGPIAAMLLGDHGASVTRIERPSGDPWAGLSGYRVWNRGKQSAVLDLLNPDDRARVHALVGSADVVIESYGAGTAEKLGVDYETLSKLNPQLIYCSITGYGERDGADVDRPAIDALVAARTGHQWEIRGRVGGTIGTLSGTPGMLPGLEAPDGVWVGPDRDGPLFSGVPWVSLGAAYVATVGVNAAIRARGITGRGQRVNASLFNGVLVTTVAAWQQVERTDAPFFETWVIDPRAPKGFFRASDGRWTHHWVPLPEFVLTAAANGMQATPGLASPKDASLRVSPMPEDMIVMHTYNDQLVEAVARYPADRWTELAGEVGVPVQTVRSPEEALLDPLLVADGCVVEVADPDLGPLRQVGRVVELERHPFEIPHGAHAPGADTDAVKAEADALISADPQPVDGPASGTPLGSPLEGITVLDLGLAVAGPWGTQVLAELGARVIKVNTLSDQFWFSNHIAMCCNRDKESIALNLKDPEAMAVLYRLVERADVVQHNMRYDAAQRLGVDYESLKQINPKLIYCHTLGHEQGPRQEHPGNDQTGAALAGTSWLDGGLDDGGRPIWSGTSLGDTGNGFLSALGVIQAIFDRDRSGEGQFIRTSILYAHMLNTSMAWISPDGAAVGARPKVDAEQYGCNALYRLYRTADGWICLGVFTDAAWVALVEAIGRADLASDVRFADAGARAAHDPALIDELAGVFATKSASTWYAILDAARVPAEISDPDYVVRLFDDPEAERQQRTASFDHRVVGRMKLAGLSFDLSDTPGVLQGGPVWPGEDSKAILCELGYSPDEVEKLIDGGAVADTSG
jgi:crotonobetainyl-CoA:carnitine CoA-transferase CaiB-like acyl-CoA transferase